MAVNLWTNPTSEGVPQIYRWALRMMELFRQGKHLSGTTREPVTFAGQVTMSDVVILSDLPTSDPTVAGQLWNDSGTLKVSAG